MKYLKYIALAGNTLYILWILYNAIDEGSSGTLMQAVIPLGLVVLLVINNTLLLKEK